ncbi:MAG: hypothetical protein ACRBBN_17540 [Methyloligellaceae bacterium]
MSVYLTLILKLLLLGSKGSKANHWPLWATAMARYINHMLVRKPNPPGATQSGDGMV